MRDGKLIKISQEVWDEIAKRGKFGEREDDVLRRVFKLSPAPSPTQGYRRGRGSKRHATKRMSAREENEKLVVMFEDGTSKEWELPDKTDKEGIRTLREEAVAFALKHGASDPGQTNAVRKALTNAGYHLIK